MPAEKRTDAEAVDIKPGSHIIVGPHYAEDGKPTRVMIAIHDPRKDEGKQINKIYLSEVEAKQLAMNLYTMTTRLFNSKTD